MPSIENKRKKLETLQQLKKSTLAKRQLWQSLSNKTESKPQ